MKDITISKQMFLTASQYDWPSYIALFFATVDINTIKVHGIQTYVIQGASKRALQP
jgi:hypothetical protein